MFSALILLIVCAALRSPEAKNAEIFNEMQALLRARREVLGESTYEVYNNGEYAVEYKMDGLVTYRSETLCARSLEGCGENVLLRRKREGMCMNMSEDLELCKRKPGEINGLCGGVEKRMAEHECESLFRERRVRVKRDECLALKKRSEQLCTRGVGKRAIDEECSFVLNAMESIDCASEAEFLEKRARKKKDCPDGWTLFKGICFKYFKDPRSWGNAEKHCETATDGSSHLVTIERMLSSGKEGKEFFHNLIQSSGALTHIDDVLSKMDDMFGGKNWREVITYYDNWAWMGLQRQQDNKFKWVEPNKPKEDWNQLKHGHGNWRKGEPSSNNDVGMDNGSCVVYFKFEKNADDSALTDTTDVGDVGAWFNGNCGLQLPFICEVDPS